MRLTDGSRQARLTLALDVTAIAVFISFGMEAHAGPGAASVFLGNFIPFCAAWLATAWFAGTYRPPTPRSLILTLLVAIGGVALHFLIGQSVSARSALGSAVPSAILAALLMLVVHPIARALLAPPARFERTRQVDLV